MASATSTARCRSTAPHARSFLLTCQGCRQRRPMFPSRKRGQAGEVTGLLGERALVYIISKYAGQARVADVSPHDLRHRFGYRMAGTVPLHRLAQLMGHDSLDTTLRYVRGTQQDLQQAVETIAWA